MNSSAIPFINTSRGSVSRRAEMIHRALEPAFPGLTDVQLLRDGGSECYGSNVGLRDCTISAGVHPAIHIRSEAGAGEGQATFLMTYLGQAEFSVGNGRKVALQPMMAGLIRQPDWHARCGDYGGVAIRVPERALLDSLALAMGRSVHLDEVQDFALEQQAGVGLRQGLEALALMFRPERAASGLYDSQLVNILALFIANHGPGGGGAQPHLRAITERACRMIEDNLKTSLTVSELARALAISERYLQLAFQGVLGTTPKQWITVRKLARAREEILADSTLTFARLSEDYAFSSPAHFSRAFRKAFGIPPSHLRN